MQFFTWMKRKYINDDSAKGNLARSMKSDGYWFPKQRRRKGILQYLKCRDASDSCIFAFEECWKEYLECGKRL